MRYCECREGVWEKDGVGLVVFERGVEGGKAQTVVYPDEFWGQLETALARDEERVAWAIPVLDEKCSGVKSIQVEEHVRKL